VSDEIGRKGRKKRGSFGKTGLMYHRKKALRGVETGKGKGLQEALAGLETEGRKTCGGDIHGGRAHFERKGV